MGVFSDDFATVDVRKELCKTKPPEKANSEGYFNRTIIPKKSRAKNNTNFDFSSWFVLFWFGAGGRTRTGTVSLPTDFESVASANFTTPAHIYLNILAQNFAFGNN